MMEESSHSSDESGEMITKEEAEVAELEQKTAGESFSTSCQNFSSDTNYHEKNCFLQM